MSYTAGKFEPTLTYSLRLRIWETNYGRDSDWVLERFGTPIALLTDPEPNDQFWVMYRLVLLTQDPNVLCQMETPDFWYEMEGFSWRNREFGMVAPSALPGAFEVIKGGGISMHGLCIDIGPPRPWDRVILHIRKIKQQRQNYQRSGYDSDLQS